ncbi:MAG: DUF4421 domain-containing protein, partial [Bdellovibrionaceae bacterium]|nr:DUF4421 domain-containing protein [Pseudobdellovibrionaceae bacterium]
MTQTLYVRLISVFCILTFCKIALGGATEISPIIGLGQENFTFEVQKFNNGGGAVKFEPNVAGILRLGLDVYGFGFGYSFRNTEKSHDAAKGETKFSDLQLGYNAKNWGINTYFQSYEGFYTSNTNTIQTYPHTRFDHNEGLFRYALNDGDFAISSLIDQSTAIKPAPIKYYAVGGISQHRMTTDIPLLQLENAGTDPQLENLQELEAYSYKIGLGAGKYWVSDNYFFVGGLVDLLISTQDYKFKEFSGNTADHRNTT